MMKFIILFISILFSGSVFAQSVFKYSFEPVQKNINATQKAETIKVLQKRLKLSNTDNAEVNYDSLKNLFVIKTEESIQLNSLKTQMLNQDTVSMKFAELYDLKGLNTFLTKPQKSAFTLKEIKKFYFFLNFDPYLLSNRASYVGILNITNDSLFFNNIKTLKAILPKDVRMLKDKSKETKQENHYIYAVKENENTLYAQKFIKEAVFIFDQLGKPAVSVNLNEEGAKIFERLTDINKGKFIAIVYNNEVILAPKVMDKISGGKLTISGTFSRDEAFAIVNNINGGTFPIKLKFVKSEIVKNDK